MLSALDPYALRHAGAREGLNLTEGERALSIRRPPA
jgi:hypothetical protein